MRPVLLRRSLLVGATALLTACATVAPPLPPSLDLPKPPSDLQASRKGDRVLLKWTIPTATTDRQTVRVLGQTLICRSISGELHDCGSSIGKIAGSRTSSNSSQKALASFTDKLTPEIESDDASAFATYAVEVLNPDGRGAGLSNQVKVPLARTLPAPNTLKADVKKEGVVLTWAGQIAPAVAEIHYGYRVYRRIDGDAQSMLIAQVPAGEQTEYSMTDSQAEWEKTYEYTVEPVTILSGTADHERDVEGDASPEAKVLVHDIFPPDVPSGLQAVFSGPGQKLGIDLVWAPLSDVDLAGYNVYRRADNGSMTKINSELIRVPAYKDQSVEAGTRYIYSVTSVDLRGNESQHSEDASETVPSAIQ